MMKKPVLVIMAAGMGSRYGVGFVSRRENGQRFREAIGDRVSRKMKVKYAFQELSDLPEGFQVPEGRTKPWGTGHAVLSAAAVTDGPFAVINADDYYGEQAFRLIYEYLMKIQEKDWHDRYVMVGYLLKNPLTENGSVSRGICTTSPDGYLETIVERTKIIRTPEGAAFSEDEGASWTAVDPDSIVSMNVWGFPADFMKELKERFPAFLKENLEENPLKCEIYLPFVVNDLMKEGKVRVQVLTTPDLWHGITYHQDKADFEQAVQELKNKGVYPQDF